MSTALATLTGDGTFRAPTPAEAERLGLPGDPHLAALLRLRSLLGDDPGEQIAARLTLPAALGTDETDHLLPGTLALLADTTGDLASYGWRLGPGTGRAWLRAQDLRGRTLDAARIALLGYAGPLQTTLLGPATLAAATYLPSGERTVSDTGAVRDVPMLLCEGIAEHLAALRERVPGARAHVLVREDAVGAVHRGTLPTPSGRRHYPALGAAEIGTLWACLLSGLAAGGLAPQDVTFGLEPDPALLRAARDAGGRRFVFSARRLPSLQQRSGRELWEQIALAHDAGCRLELVVDPREGSTMGADLQRTLESWRSLGYAAADAAGITLMAHTGATHAARTGHRDPSEQPSRSTLLTEEALVSLLRRAPRAVEQLAA